MSIKLFETIETMCSCDSVNAVYRVDDNDYCYEPVVAICVTSDSDSDGISGLVVSEIGFEFADSAINFVGYCPKNQTWEEFANIKRH